MTPATRSTLVDASERPIDNLSWTPPNPSSQYFGWLGEHGFTTVHVSDIQAICPHPNDRNSHVIILENVNFQVAINNLDAGRLMKRLGWKEPNV